MIGVDDCCIDVSIAVVSEVACLLLCEWMSNFAIDVMVVL